MKLVLACLACTTACGFHAAAGPVDGSDDAVVDAVPPDAPSVLRTRTDLIGLWELDESAGTTLADTSDAMPKVLLTVNVGSVTFANGMMMPNGVAVVASGPAPRLNANVIAGAAVTLEAWVMPARADQGTPAEPALVAGLCSSIKARNISILQVGKRWVARVRTTADPNGKPDLMSTTDIVAGAMTHVVVVADATQRILYVDGKADRVDPAPGPPLNWDKSYKMTLGNELAQGRQWAGAFGLVALYQRALSKELVATNFNAGANGH